MKNKALLIYAYEDMEKNKWFTDRLITLAGERGIEMKLTTSEDVKIRFSPQAARLQNGLINPGFISMMDSIAFVINRSRDAEISKFFEGYGLPSFNNSDTVLMGNDKILEYGFFKGLGLPVMDTVRGDTPEEEISFGPPYVVKHRRGHGGSRVFAADSYNEALGIMEGTPRTEWIIQRMCDEPGCDMRLYILGGRILAGVLRRSEKDFRSNFSLGGKAELVTPDPEICSQALKVSGLLEADYIGIDLIRDGGRYVFNEIEDAVGARMLYEVSELDAAGLFMEHIFEKTFQKNENGIK